MTKKDEANIDAILDRGVISDILPSKEAFKKLLLSGKKIKIYIGFDPTSAALHLSHAKNLMVLEEFRKLGHEVIVLFGDFTARIGDPSDRSGARKQLSEAEVKQNVKLWSQQIKPLMDFVDAQNPPKILYNSEWLSKLKFGELIELASNFTLQQMIERNMFQQRLESKSPVGLHEFLYPLMQGYDSVAMDVDAELCGTDQTFNALAGRTLMRRLKNKEKFVLTVNLMENPKTKELMSKSNGVGVFLDQTANNMYGQIMSQPDEMIEILLINNTRIPLEEIAEMDIANNPLESKKKAAHEIVKIFFGASAADKAAQQFDKQFKDHQTPDDIPEIKINKSTKDLADTLVKTKLASSKSEARRLIDQGGVKLNSKPADENTTVKNGDVLQVGKRKFVKVTQA